jgi:hypothetical protein
MSRLHALRYGRDALGHPRVSVDFASNSNDPAISGGSVAAALKEKKEPEVDVKEAVSAIFHKKEPQKTTAKRGRGMKVLE